MPVLRVDDLHVRFGRGAGSVPAVRGIGFELNAGECLAIVGESGSGKSVTARALLGLAGPNAQVRARTLRLGETDLTRLSARGWRSVRGREIGLILQDALTSLDPLRPVAAEVIDTLRAHRLTRTRGEAAGRVDELLRSVGIDDPEIRKAMRPHQLSGGQRQRVLIATALAGGPKVIIADEPTTALDVTVQARILRLLRSLRDDGAALLLISHDLAVVADIADTVAVMHEGRIVEHGPTTEILGAPRHPYTQRLLAAVPTPDKRGKPLSPRHANTRPTQLTENSSPSGSTDPAHPAISQPDGTTRSTRPATSSPANSTPANGTPTNGTAANGTAANSTPANGTAANSTPANGSAKPEYAPPSAISVTGLHRAFRLPNGDLLEAVRDVSFELAVGATLGLVGESGSGKSTTAALVLGLLEPDAGTVTINGKPWSGVPEKIRRSRRTELGVIWQDPASSFDPRWDVTRIIGEALHGRALTAPARRRVTLDLLDAVGLPAAFEHRRPGEMSGGQRQRVAIARALATDPAVLICDEPVSALDVTIQAQILDLLAELKVARGLSMLFVSHDLSVVQHISDTVAVMSAGRIVEHGGVEEVFDTPRHDVTRALLSAARHTGHPHAGTSEDLIRPAMSSAE